VFVTGLEHKMGLTVSATTELTFGQHGVPVTGWLVGDTHRGIAQMFKLIEYARMMLTPRPFDAVDGILERA
jgi:alkylation response protein AidB-like acyl-CoA dehydrogenase